MREHGTRSRYVRGPDENNQPGPCRCPACSRANNEHHNRAYRLKAYGRWQPYVDAEPARKHVRGLVAAGVRPRRVSELAGVSQPTVKRLLDGKPSKGVPPSQKIRVRTAEALLAVRLEGWLKPGSAVDGTATRRRLQALVAAGWALTAIARRSGISHKSLAVWIRADSVTVATEVTIAALYDALWDAPAPEVTGRERAAAAKARSRAAVNGWAPPMAWDDSAIGDPAARPQGWRAAA